MNGAKIQLSEEELLLVKNADWVLTKNKIIRKVYELFGSLSGQMESSLDVRSLPGEVLINPPRISRGENYNGLPYVMMDYPRFFSRDTVFAIRSFFWWGNYFSITFHVKGKFKEAFAGALQNNLDLLAQNDFYVCVSGEEWRHELDADNYHAISTINRVTFDEIARKHSFIKLSAKINFQQWDEAESLFLKQFHVLLQSICG